MAEPLRPGATKSYLRENWIFIPSIASATLAPTVAEATGASSLDITNIVFSDGAPTPNQSTNRARQNRRLGDSGSYEFIGETQYEGGEMTYAHDPQSAPGANGRKLYEKIPAGTTGFLAHRQAIAKATSIAAAQKLSAVWPVEFGPSAPTNSGDGESAEAAQHCAFAITGPPAFDVAVLA